MVLSDPDEGRMAGPARFLGKVKATSAISAWPRIKTLFVERRFPDRIVARLPPPPLVVTETAACPHERRQTPPRIARGSGLLLPKISCLSPRSRKMRAGRK